MIAPLGDERAETAANQIMDRSNSLNLIALRPRVRPFRLHWVSRARSTNDLAMALRRRGELFAPAIVIASRQLRGRGRGTNAWWSAEGSLTATFVMPVAEHLRPHQVPLLAGLAAREAIQSLCPSASIRLKWPNDLLFDGRKLAGLLCERADNLDLIGIGVNVNIARRRFPARVRNHATSLQMVLGQRISMSEVVAALASGLHARLSRHNDHHFGAVLREYDRHHALVGRRIAVDVGLPERSSASSVQRLSGTCVGLDAVGRLLLRETERGTKRGTKSVPGRGKSGVLHRIVAGHVSVR